MTELVAGQVHCHQGRELELNLAMTLWWLRYSEPLITVGQRFGYKTFIVHAIINRMLHGLVQLMPKLSNDLNDPAKRNNISIGFKMYSEIPGIVGVVNATRFRAIRPLDEYPPEDWYHMGREEYSVKFQCITDAEMCFTNLYCEVSDVRTKEELFYRSTIYKSIVNGTLVLKDQHLVGNYQYINSPFCVIPYKENRELLPEQERFNERLRQVNAHGLNALKLLKRTFRKLKMIETHNPNGNEEILVIAACCSIHNHIIREHTFEQIWPVGNFLRDQILNDPRNENSENSYSASSSILSLASTAQSSLSDDSPYDDEIYGLENSRRKNLTMLLADLDQE